MTESYWYDTCDIPDAFDTALGVAEALECYEGGRRIAGIAEALEDPIVLRAILRRFARATAGHGEAVQLFGRTPPARVGTQEDVLIRCPFVYAKGRACTGHIVRVEAYKADLTWSAESQGTWSFDFEPRSHYHVFCSEKGNHAGFRRQDPNALKFWFDTLPAPIQKILLQTKPN